LNERIKQLLTAAHQYKASDIHLTVGVPPIFRINGQLKRFGSEILKPAYIEELVKAIVRADLQERYEKVGEVDFSYSLPGVSRFRVNAYHQRGSPCLAIRIVPTEIPTLEALEMPPVLKKLAKSPKGLVLVTGPTGSGKSSTLAAMIDYINKTMAKHIITLEDPIEFLHKHQYSVIEQREIGIDTQSFSNGLSASLRQDPDIILVGEMRDLETISTAVTAAETGHLVMATLHTTDAVSTIDRIIGIFPPAQQKQIRIQLASALVAVISQRLFQKKDNSGRQAATEILINTPAIANLIRSEKVHQIHSLLAMGRESGMHAMEMSIKDLLQKQLISEEAALPYLRGGEA